MANFCRMCAVVFTEDSERKKATRFKSGLFFYTAMPPQGDINDVEQVFTQNATSWVAMLLN
jgi:hypothetical protein